jgi:hypothetical protein
MQSYATSEAVTSANIYGPQKDQHMNIDMDVPYSNFGPGIIPGLFEQNCGSTITESSSSSEPVAFQLNPQQVQLDQEVSDHDSCLRKLLQRLEGSPVDHHSNNNMTMISTRSPINASQIQYFNAHNQYNSEAASQISYETSVTPVLVYARHMEHHIKLENPSSALVQNDNSVDFSASSSPEGGNYDSVWMNNDWSDCGIFSKELNDLLLYNDDALVQQREACNHACGSIRR